MVPSVGFFIVAPLASIVVPKTNPGDLTTSKEDFQSKLHELCEEIDWKFCFEQGCGSGGSRQDCHLYF